MKLLAILAAGLLLGLALSLSDANAAPPLAGVNRGPFIADLRQQEVPIETAIPAMATPTMDASPTRPAPSRLPRATARATHVRFLRGQATWWFSWGHGFYVAVNPADGIRVGSVIQVCDAHAQRCIAAPVTTTCACLGPDSGRIVDLSLDLFSRFADPALGVTSVVLEVTP